MHSNTDYILKELVKRTQEQILPPPADEMWCSIRSELRKRKKLDLLCRYRRVMAVGVIIAVLTTTLICFRTPVIAFSAGIFRYVTMFKSFNVIIQNDDGSNIVEMQASEDDIAKYPLILQFMQKAPFKILIPQYIPKGFKLKSINMHSNYGIDAIKMLFMNSLDISGKECFELVQHKDQANSDMDSGITSDTIIKSEQFSKYGIAYTLIYHEGYRNILQWNAEGISFMIDGNLPKNELIKIAEQIKQDPE